LVRKEQRQNLEGTVSKNAIGVGTLANIQLKLMTIDVLSEDPTVNALKRIKENKRIIG